MQIAKCKLTKRAYPVQFAICNLHFAISYDRRSFRHFRTVDAFQFRKQTRLGRNFTPPSAAAALLGVQMASFQLGQYLLGPLENHLGHAG